MLSNETTASSDINDDDANEALLTVIGFLEACVPRMVELIEAAAQGALSPETFEECFVVNDKLTNALADADKDPKDRQPLTTAAVGGGGGSASSDNSSGTAIMQNNADGIGEGMKQLQLLSVAGGGKTTGLLDSEETKMPESEDPFAGGLDLLAPTPPAAVFKISESLGSSESASEADGVAAAAAAGGGAAKAENDDDFDAFFRDRTAAP